MANSRLWIMKSSQDMERLNLISKEVSALRLFHPTVSFVLFGIGFIAGHTVSTEMEFVCI
jgi:hypothetical protein